MEVSKRKSLCIRVCLYTLFDKKFQDNLYIEIFLLWIATIYKYAGLDENDVIQLITDKETVEYLENETFFFKIQAKLKCPIIKYCLLRPVTNLEGMMYKYIFTDYKQDIFMYCDIDVLIVKPIHEITNLIPNETIVVHKEGLIHHSDYGCALAQEELAKIPKDTMGFSAGKFFIHGKELHKELYKTIYNYYLDNKKTDYYTVEQPLFNKAICNIDVKKCNLDLNLMDDKVWKEESENKNVYFVDHCGVPGDGYLHFQKMIDTIVLLYADAL